jgi:hypothetical protein
LCSASKILAQKCDFLTKIGLNFQVAEKSLMVEFKNHWNLLAEFNSDPTTIAARQRGKPLESNWRREGNSNFTVRHCWRWRFLS